MFFNRYQVTLVLITKPCAEPSLLDVSDGRASQTTAGPVKCMSRRCLRCLKAVLASLSIGSVELVPTRGPLLLPFQCLRQKHLALRPASVSLLLSLATQMLLCKVGRQPLLWAFPQPLGLSLGGAFDVLPLSWLILTHW